MFLLWRLSYDLMPILVEQKHAAATLENKRSVSCHTVKLLSFSIFMLKREIILLFRKILMLDSYKKDHDSFRL